MKNPASSVFVVDAFYFIYILCSEFVVDTENFLVT